MRLPVAFFTIVLAAVNVPTPGWLGMGYVYRTRTDAGRTAGWLQILSVEPNSPAAKGGLRPRDIVTHFDGKPLVARDQLAMIQLLRRIRPGQRVRLSVRRGENAIAINVTAARMNAAQERLWREGLEYEQQRAKP
jgi:S1-C subfamily serine protease